MDASVFYPQIIDILAAPPVERHVRLTQLHGNLLSAYLAAIAALTPEQTGQTVALGTESRTLLQVVGHIMEWERFMILAAGDVLAGLKTPRMVTSLAGYVEPNGHAPAFTSIADFNTYQAEKHARWTWEQMHTVALETATTLFALFTKPGLLTPQRLENTQHHRKRLLSGTVIDDLAMGWSLWIIALEHEGVEHAPELGIA